MEAKSFMIILSFRNCELHCCHLDGYGKQGEDFLKRIADVENFFMEKPDTCKFRIWYNVDETLLDEELIVEIAASVECIQNHIVKIAFIGMKRMQQWSLSKKLKLQAFQYTYFSDAEKAKEWLV